MSSVISVDVVKFDMVILGWLAWDKVESTTDGVPNMGVDCGRGFTLGSFERATLEAGNVLVGSDSDPREFSSDVFEIDAGLLVMVILNLELIKLVLKKPPSFDGTKCSAAAPGLATELFGRRIRNKNEVDGGLFS